MKIPDEQIKACEASTVLVRTEISKQYTRYLMVTLLNPAVEMRQQFLLILPLGNNLPPVAALNDSTFFENSLTR